MGWVEGVVTLLTGWAWPIVVLVAVLVLKKEIGKLITRLMRFSGAGVEAEFREQVEAVNDLAGAIAPDAPDELTNPPGGTRLAPRPTLADLMTEAKVHPVGAIVRAWTLIEAEVARVTTGKNRPMNARLQLQSLVGEGKISPELFSVGYRLFELRSKVVHGAAIPNEDEAREFVSAAWRLLSELSKLETWNPTNTT